MTAFITLPGFPIRTSPGHSSLDNSPELFAACYVLLRLSTPRHPPSALHSLISIPLLQSLRAVKKSKILLRILSNPLFRHLIILSKSLDLLALNIYRFLLFCFQRLFVHPSGPHHLAVPNRRGGLIRVLEGSVKIFFQKK